MDRDTRARMGRETVEIVRAGGYRTSSGKMVDISMHARAAIEGTRTILPGDVLPMTGARKHETSISVTTETSLGAARRLSSGDDPERSIMVLNFASARNPGGGFRNGARAQEESLAMSSALFACIESSSMYAANRGEKDCIYTDFMIHSPGVPVFRDDEGVLLEVPYSASILTAPAVNAGVVLKQDPSRRDEVEEVMRRRIGRVLGAALKEGHDVLVLGAWGCGVFQNDPDYIARAFGTWISGSFQGSFREIVFAVPGDPGDSNLSAFIHAFPEKTR